MGLGKANTVEVNAGVRAVRFIVGEEVGIDRAIGIEAGERGSAGGAGEVAGHLV